MYTSIIDEWYKLYLKCRTIVDGRQVPRNATTLNEFHTMIENFQSQGMIEKVGESKKRNIKGKALLYSNGGIKSVRRIYNDRVVKSFLEYHTFAQQIVEKIRRGIASQYTISELLQSKSSVISYL